uniref:Uncharacterized protein n=1 Tax=Oryza sativa subsp. japonica TaxID=39947 RepID=Q5Z4Y0_ORYSJ|nr:hypothetical protein [Oryza sativa Japonica Group]
MRTYGNLVVMKWCSRHLSGAVMKKKPRKFEEGMSSIAHICPEAITYLKKVGKYLQEDKDEQEKLVRVFQRKDGGYRWGIMSRPLGLELGGSNGCTGFDGGGGDCTGWLGSVWSWKTTL